jgi:hypothetical protein
VWRRKGGMFFFFFYVDFWTIKLEKRVEQRNMDLKFIEERISNNWCTKRVVSLEREREKERERERHD